MNMATTLEALERRLGVLEQEMASWRPLLAGQPIEETPAERGARLLAQARRDKSRQKMKSFGFDASTLAKRYSSVPKRMK
jgi:hypothetical protein